MTFRGLWWYRVLWTDDGILMEKFGSFRRKMVSKKSLSYHDLFIFKPRYKKFLKKNYGFSSVSDGLKMKVFYFNIVNFIIFY